MTTLNVLIPRQPVPELKLPLLGGETFDLAVSPAPTFAMLVFYRGLHCPLCAKYLLELEKLHDDFVQRGVIPLAVSTVSAAGSRSCGVALRLVKVVTSLLPCCSMAYSPVQAWQKT